METISVAAFPTPPNAPKIKLPQKSMATYAPSLNKVPTCSLNVSCSCVPSPSTS